LLKARKAPAVHIIDMTQGNSLSLIVRFGLPLIIANTLQQVYAMVDTVILGRFNGVTGLAALGTSSWPVWLSVSIMTNFAQASSLLLSKRFGAGKMEELKKATGNVYFIAVLLGLVLTLLSQVVARPFLMIQNTPAEVFGDAIGYLRISYAGIPILLSYNIFAALLRAVGDSRTPLHAIIAATFVNIGLDLLFVAHWGLGAPGAAMATVLAQVASAIVCFLRLRTYDLLHVKKHHLRLNKNILTEFFSLSIPMLLQSFAIAFGGFFVQTHVNGYGASFAAGMSATGKVFGLLETAAIALAQAASTFISQNYGAARFDRIRKGLKHSLWISLGIATFLACSMFLFGKGLLGLFVAPEAIQTAWELLVIMSIGLWIMYPMYVIRQAIQALGNAVIPLIAAIIQIFARVLVTLYFPLFLGQKGMYFTTVTAWLTSLILIGIVYPIWQRRCERKFAAREAA